MSKRSIGLLLVTAIAVISVPAATASTIYDSTNNVTWRNLVNVVQDRNAVAFKNGEMFNYVVRYGDRTDSEIAARYAIAPTAEKNFIARGFNQTTGQLETTKFQNYRTSLQAAEARIEAGTASATTRQAAVALYKYRKAMGLAARMGSIGAVALTVGTGANLVEKAIVGGENRVFGWHIQLSGPFGIFGSWDHAGEFDSQTGDLSSTTIRGIKWKKIASNAFCGSSCSEWDPLMDTGTGVTFNAGDTSTNINTDNYLWMAVLVVDTTSAAGATTFGTRLTSGIKNVPACDFTYGWSTTTNSSKCVASVYQQNVLEREWASIDPDRDSGLPHVGHWVLINNTGGDATGVSTHTLGFVLTPSEMEHYLDGKHSYTYERTAGSGDHTRTQGDPDQVSESSSVTTSPTAVPETDTQLQTAQDAGRDALDDPDVGNTANQHDCASVGGTSGGLPCPDPFAAAFTVPDCIGAVVAVCVSDLQAIGFTADYTQTELDWDHADMGIDAGAIVVSDPAANVDADQDTIFHFDVNPDPLPLVIPTRSSPNQTGDELQAELEAGGATGTITITTVTDTNLADGRYGPSAWIRVTNTTTSEVYTPGERIAPDTTITITQNPPGMPVVPEPTDSSCNCPPLNFGPLTALDVGSKFPFGIFVYASAIIGNFNVSPQAPDFNLTAQATGMNGHNLNAPYDVNLGGTRMGWLDTYMGYWRTLLSFCMWVGAIWFVGSRLLGFHGTGDPGGGVDEVL
jgi:hypothetical protein